MNLVADEIISATQQQPVAARVVSNIVGPKVAPQVDFAKILQDSVLNPLVVRSFDDITASVDPRNVKVVPVVALLSSPSKYATVKCLDAVEPLSSPSTDPAASLTVKGETTNSVVAPSTDSVAVTSYISIDLGTVNFGMCHVGVSRNERGGAGVAYRILGWTLQTICSSELNETETVHMIIDAFFAMFPNGPPAVDHILIEQQHRINRTTDFSAHALLALFRSAYRNTRTCVHMPNGSMKVEWAVQQFGAALPQRSDFNKNHSYNKAVARAAMPLILNSKALQAYQKCPKKDDLADTLLQALAYDRFVVRPKGVNLVMPREAARLRNATALANKKERDELSRLAHLHAARAKRLQAKGQASSEPHITSKVSKRTKQCAKRKLEREEESLGSLPLLREFKSKRAHLQGSEFEVS
jgi:hypothetical protein